jgi:ParB-like chromosome segregation protein Spo0J
MTREPGWIGLVPIEELRCDPDNARRHSRKNIESIKNSLGLKQQKTIVVQPDGMVLAGNGTLKAARELGWTELLVRVTELQGAEARAYALADNRTGELATWDGEKLAGELTSIKKLDLKAFDGTGFTERDLGKLVPVLDRIDLLNGAEGDQPPAHKMTITVTFWEHDEPAVLEALQQLRSKVPGVHYVS